MMGLARLEVQIERRKDLRINQRTLDGFVRHGWLSDPEPTEDPARSVYFVTDAGREAARAGA
ncbi:MAG: hypothetical protein IT459_14820 [Planctomycetes bacterium]|nr:hypothetical protein [Planctomycetota bacterium]